MTFNPKIHHRRSVRLWGYDYSRAGAYFVTIRAQARECLFGEVRDGAMLLNAAGEILRALWEALPVHYAHVDLDAWVIMPNHVHGIIVLDSSVVDVVGAGSVRAGLKPAPTTECREPRRLYGRHAPYADEPKIWMM